MGKKDDLAGDLLRGRKIKKKIIPTAEEVTEVVKKVTTSDSQPEKEQNVEAAEPKETKTKVKQEAPSSPADTENTVVATADEPQVEKLPKPESKKVEKKLIRTTIDLPAYVHKAIKVKAAQEGISLKRYLVSLVKSDLNLG